MTEPKLIAVGAVCYTTLYRVDTVPALPAKAVASAACRVVDGMAISAAAAFAKLGGEADVWARIGDDAVGATMVSELQAAGLGVTALRRVAGATSSHAAVVIDQAGDRLVVPYHQPDLDADPAWLPLAEIAAADVVHADIRWPDGAAAALAHAQRLGVRTMLDAEVGPRDVLARLLPLASHAVFSDAGLAAFTGEADLEQGLRAVAAWHPGHVGASCGADGYAWIETGVIHRVPALPVEVIDTLAAGDVFHGAFALALAEGQPIAAAARFACVAASLKCTRFGGRLGCPTRAEVAAAVAG